MDVSRVWCGAALTRGVEVTYAFFEDLHRIQDFRKEIWTQYRDGAIDLSTCAVTTNLALVRRAEDDIISQAPMEAISVLIFYAGSFKKGNEPNQMLKSDELLQTTPLDEFIYFSTAHLLDLPQIKKWEEEDEYLTQLLMDTSSDDTVSKAMKEINKDREAPAVDELSKGLDQLRREGEAKGIEARPPPDMADNIQQVGLRPIKLAGDPFSLSTNNPTRDGTLPFNMEPVQHKPSKPPPMHLRHRPPLQRPTASQIPKNLLASHGHHHLNPTHRTVRRPTPAHIQKLPKQLRPPSRNLPSSLRPQPTQYIPPKPPTLNITRKDGSQISNTQTSNIISEYINNQQPPNSLYPKTLVPNPRHPSPQTR
ncbi:MAG: hypothetical protein Q9204_003515 [Flavoplaca sp. TL-2023a]